MMLSKIDKELTRNEGLFHDFFEIAPEGVTVLDFETMTFIKCNGSAARLLKYHPTEILSLGPANISPEFQPDGVRSTDKALEYAKRAIAGEKLVFEWLVLDAHQQTFIAEVRLVAISGTHKPMLYASFVDITDRKENHRKLEEQNTKLTEIAFLQSHQVRKPVANILGVINLFNFNDCCDPINAQLLIKLKTATAELDNVIHEIVVKTNQIKDNPTVN